MLVVQRTLPNVIASVHRYLMDHQYQVGATVGTFRSFFPGLVIFPAYPDDLERLKTPVLALGGIEFTRSIRSAVIEDPDFFGAALFGVTYRLPMYGFVVGQGGDRQNKAFRDRLMSDLIEVLVHEAGDEGIPLYDHESKQDSGSSIEVTNASARVLPVNAPTVEADRYKFVVEIDVAYA